MSLRINNNIAAINAHRNLVNTTMDLNKSMEKLSSGYRINRAADNPAGLVISEQFRAQIAGLNRAIDNSEGSINMIQTAEGALTELNALLVSMRELAIHAANEGFNDTAQLEADQAEIDNAIKTIDRISANTQFGTKKLLDGSKANTAAFTTDGTSGVTIRESFLSDGEHYITATKTSDSTASLNTITSGVTLDTTTTPAGEPTNLSDGVHNLDIIQTSTAATKGNGTAVVIQDNWNNGITFGAAASVASLFGSDIGTALNSTNNGDYTFHIAYQDGANVMATVDLSITIKLNDAETAGAATLVDILNTAISGTDLAGTIIATQNGSDDLGFATVELGATQSVAVEAFNTSDYVASTYSDGSGVSQAAAIHAGIDTTAAASARGVSDARMRFQVVINSTYDNDANQTATITLENGTVNTMAALVATINAQLELALGAGGFGTVGAGVQNLTAALDGPNNDRIQFYTADQGSAYSVRAYDTTVTGAGSAAAALGMAIDTVAWEGRDAMIRLDEYTNTLDRVDYGADRDYSLYDSGPTEDERGTVNITVDGLNATGGGLTLGNLLLSVNAARFSVSVDGGTAQSVVAGVDTIVYDNTRLESAKINIDLSAEGGSEVINNTDRSLVFQIGANVGQTTKIALRNMSASYLGTNIEGNMFRSLSEINVMTVQGAQDSQEIIDEAINEVSTTRGTLGSFQKNTLESNLRNLRIASQNLQSSESNIRDTDMASEMSNFVKNQILMQAGTAMLAHGNQMPQVVLSLFQ